ncbi:carboxylesterase/lipase family protein [Actinomadura citrea]|uniref:Carboxylic ester hydrolase n=1 Tax=Actinomadura citrea TaxID=46158 RepID=A0A7Y9GJH0_9ACTN|nr:carboxylesterase family protein [Actinomadura citrea]NYE17656.1 para-nitrobenzyl esterase [Actinomadura citrea]GGT60856.1 carboxylic ester hydrolase [Actinomadura citrea]
MIVEMAAGRVRGVSEGPLTAFRGIPYARADRFAAPGPVRPWPGVRNASAPGPAAPQPASRLERVMGGFQAAQSEEKCLTLNVWAPPGDGHPVLVFLHGGGFTSGSGGLDWYGGGELAAQGDLVVVTLNYRLGVLGFLRLPGLSEGNLGLLDQLAALRWVRDNVAAFGGDPGKVTVAGQSAGAQSILALLSGGRAHGLFGRAILQSTPAGMLPDSPDEAERTGALLLDELGVEPGQAARLVDLPVSGLLAAHGAVARRTAAPLSAVPPFQLVADGDLVAADPVAEVGRRAAGGVQLMMGTTRDEAAAFYALDDQVAALGPDELARIAAHWFGDPGRAAPEGRTAARIAIDLATDQMFREPTLRLAESLTGNGAAPWLYRFDWHPPHSPYGACHCIDLPFVLGTPGAWRDAPMLDGAPPAGLVREVRRHWTGFVRQGDPGWAAGTTHHFTDEPAGRT